MNPRDPVRRGFSVQSLRSLGYWVTRLRAPARVTTVEYAFAVSRHVCPRFARELPPSPSRGKTESALRPAYRFSRQLVFAPCAQALFRLELRHAEQMAEHLQPMALRQLDQFGNGLRDKGNGLVGAALLASFIGSLIGWRFPTLTRHKVLPRNNPFDGATLGRISQLDRYKSPSKVP